MKDAQVAPASAEPRIFLVSPVLHCVSMTVLVYLRSSFGFGYLRPKSLFFAFSWAFALYAAYAWMEEGVWQERRAALWFGAGAVALYWFHLLTVLRREWRGTATHDNFSGHSNLLAVLRWRATPAGDAFEQRLRLWGEPALAVAAAILLRAVFSERHLSAWLLFVGLCFWLKEALNQWFHLRQRKRHKDILEDAEDAFDGQRSNHAAAAAPPPATARKAKINRQRATGSRGENKQT